MKKYVISENQADIIEKKLIKNKTVLINESQLLKIKETIIENYQSSIENYPSNNLSIQNIAFDKYGDITIETNRGIVTFDRFKVFPDIDERAEKLFYQEPGNERYEQIPGVIDYNDKGIQIEGNDIIFTISFDLMEGNVYEIKYENFLPKLMTYIENNL